MHPIESTKRKRRTYSKRFKAELVAECLAGEDSIASIALRHDINPNLVHRWVTENRRSGQHELSELSEPKGKSNIPAAPLNWVAAVPVNTGPQKTYTPQAAQHKPPSTARTQSIAIKIAGKQCHITLEWPTQEGSKLTEFIRELLI